MKIGAFILGVILCLFITFKVFEWNWYKSLLPDDIEVKTFYIYGGEAGLREGCGASVFYLTDRAQKDLREKGINYFKTPSEWKQTPLVPKGENAVEEIGTGLSCAKYISESLKDKIGRAQEKEGGYYKFGHESTILVLPELGIAVYGYFG